ncbi:MAG: T9SS type A sorting domain-containing protein [Bacteroidetes bacterium]|nr:T9SS type A sorting domain-containing protein [Bacteroidota bacterium]
MNNFKISRVAVYNIMGRVIKETKIENNIRLDLSSLNNGFYYVYFYSDDKIISVNKITINH